MRWMATPGRNQEKGRRWGLLGVVAAEEIPQSISRGRRKGAVRVGSHVV